MPKERRAAKTRAAWIRWLNAALFTVILAAARSDARDWSVDDPAAVYVRQLADEYRFQAILDTVPALIRGAIADGDSLRLGRFLCARGQGRLGTGQVAASFGDLERAERLAAAHADTLTWLTSLGVQAFAVGLQGRFDAMVDLAQRQGELARHANDRVGEAFASLSLGYAQLNLGRYQEARIPYSVARAAFHAAGLTGYELTASIGLGRALTELGELDAAYEIYSSVIEPARRIGDLRNEADANNNLGTIEFRRRRIDRAAAYFERAYSLQLQLGNEIGAAWIMNSYALIRSWTGHHDEAEQIVERAREIARESGATLDYHTATLSLAVQHLNRGALGAASALYREVLAATTALELRLRAAMELSWTLVYADSVASAAQLLRRAEGWFEEAKLPPSLDFLRQQAQVSLYDGRPDAALASARALIRQHNSPVEAGALRALMAQCFAASGQIDSARVQLEYVVRGFELDRTQTVELRWRDVSSSVRYTRAVDSVLACHAASAQQGRSAADRDYADYLLRLKARSVLDRLAPDSELDQLSPQISLDQLQARLRPGELLLDFYEGFQWMLLMVVSRDEYRAVDLSGERRSLAQRVQNWCDVLGSSASGDAKRSIQEAAGRRLAHELFGEASQMVEHATRIIFVPDGVLTALPLGALVVGDESSEPLGLRAEITRLPAATLLGSAPAKPAGQSGILALIERDGELVGARREVQTLKREFAEVRVHEGHPGELDRLYDRSSVLHVAAHTEIHDDLAWYSGIRLESDVDGPDPIAADTHLRAMHLLQLELPQRLAFLAACESGGGRNPAGSGVLGLSTAFLIARIPSVIATLWPVDDLTTARLVDAFYAQLATGGTVAAALQAAQVEIRSNPATSEPYYWAGFFLVGDADTLVPLRRRPFASSQRWPILFATGVLTGGLWLAVRRHRAANSPLA